MKRLRHCPHRGLGEIDCYECRRVVDPIFGFVLEAILVVAIFAVALVLR